MTEILRHQGVMAPIIGVTADLSGRGNGTGMTEVLYKPYTLEELGKVLGKHLVMPSQATLISPVEGIMSERWAVLFGSEITARTMAVEYLRSNEADLVRLSEAYMVLNWNGMTNAAHSIKGAADMVGEYRLAELAAVIENLSMQEQSNSLSDLIIQLQNKIKNISIDIQSWLNNC
ncbi:aerobic respiration control sensor protein ArcB [compost metagenome]